MEFKIDTKPNFIMLTPVSNHLDAKLTAALSQKWEELTQSGSANFIIDLHNCLDADNASFNELTLLHENCYNAGQSLVFTGMNEEVLAALKKEELDTVLNITPTMAEAVDIVNMEILERDLFKEDD